MWAHPALSRQKVTPRDFGVVRTSSSNVREREKERVERKVEAGGASVTLSVTLQINGVSSGLLALSALTIEGEGDLALATY